MKQKAMSKEKIHLAELSEHLSHQTGISRKTAEEFLKLLSEIIEESLLKRDSVKIKGLGTFKLQWNEPRKSVDVNTGTEILIEGYYKVAFSPDANLKEAINEPYAHLETVVLDDANLPVKQTKAVVETQAQSFEYFTEQASEIKGILTEIDAMHKDKRPEVDVELPNAVVESTSQVQKESDDDPQTVSEVEAWEPTLQIVPNNDNTTEAKTETSKSKSLVLMLLLGMIIGAALVYVLNELEMFEDSRFSFFVTERTSLPESVPVVELPEDVVYEEEILIIEEEPVDTLQMLFDEVREYTEFIATETVIVGSRLTRIAERHYGQKLFWVFIYEANRSLIEHPENVRVGTVLRIPKLNPVLADMDNERCVEYMRNLQRKYLMR